VEQQVKIPFFKRHPEFAALQVLFLIVIVLVITLPVFMSIYNHIPEFYIPGTDRRIDHIVTFLLVFLSIYLISRKIRHLLYLMLATTLFTLGVLHVLDRYKIQQIVLDYRMLLYSMNESAVKFEFTEPDNPEDKVFPKATEFREAIDFTNPITRNYAASIAVMHFEEHQTNSNMRLIQFFSVFKEVRKRWRYVFDPTGRDYFSKASETIGQLKMDGKFKGDCDDYSILMAACIKSVGGEVKLVRTRVDAGGVITGHVYPEVLVGTQKDLETINYLIREVLFVKENKGKPIYYHVDKNHNVWLNFDYNDYYPGGKYQSTVRMGELKV
jgi:hypothetical protein